MLGTLESISVVVTEVVRPSPFVAFLVAYVTFADLV